MILCYLNSLHGLPNVWTLNTLLTLAHTTIKTLNKNYNSICVRLKTIKNQFLFFEYSQIIEIINQNQQNHLGGIHK